MKPYKIIVCIDSDERTRKEMIKRIVVKLGFATIPSDANKIIKASPHDFAHDSYFVFAHSYNFRSSPITTQELIKRALNGEAIVIGAKRVPSEYQPFAVAYYPNQIL